MKTRRERAAYEDFSDHGRVYFDVVGEMLKVDDKVADCFLFNDKGEPVYLSQLPTERKLFNVINSIDTPICKQETCNLDSFLTSKKNSSLFTMCTVSMDLPFALRRFRMEELLDEDHLLLSDYRNADFGRNYGVLMMAHGEVKVPDRLLQRAVFIVEPNNVISYVKYFEDQGAKPDYSEALEVLRR